MKHALALSFSFLLGLSRSPAAQPPAPVWPERVFSPYVDVTFQVDLAGTARKVGIQFFNLAFIVSKSHQKPIPAWGGVGTLKNAYMTGQITRLRAMGCDAMVSFGGAAGMELAWAAEALPSSTALQALVDAYQAVIDVYGFTHLDFDIEGAAIARPKSIALRFQAIKILQARAKKERRRLKVWFTLPVLPSGLNYWGKAFVSKAVAAGVDFEGVNIMAMDYGGPSKHMGKDAIDAATNTHRQLMGILKNKTSAQVWAMIGITPMIGRNDVAGEFFYQKDMRMVLSFARQKKIGLLSFWSLTRDFPPPSGQMGQVSPHHSGIPQKDYEFSRICAPYTSPWRNLGLGLAGPAGMPVLKGTGTLDPNTAFSLDLTKAPASAPAFLLLGTSRWDLKLFGGVLVPKPRLVLPGTTGSAGTLQWKASWPGWVPFGTGLYYQAWCADKSSPSGLCASNALESRNR